MSVENVDYRLTIDETEEGMVNVILNGSFEIDGQQAQFNSDGKVRKYELEESTFYMGALRGNISIGGKEREAFVALEKLDENVYFSITINRIGSEEGYMIIQFGDVLASESILERIETRKESSSDHIVTPLSDYIEVDYDWATFGDYSTMGLRTGLYLEDDIYLGGAGGRIVTTVQVDKNAIANTIKNNFGADYVYVAVECFESSFMSFDQESEISGHNPDESDSSSQVIDFILGILNDIFKIPTSTLAALLSGIGNDITITYDNDHNRRDFEIWPYNDDVLDRSQNPNGGYPVEISIIKDSKGGDRDLIKNNTDALIYVHVLGETDFVIGTKKCLLEVNLKQFN